MTDRTISIIVALDEEYGTDDAEMTLNAIRMIRGVLNAEIIVKGHKQYLEQYAFKQQVKNELMKKLHDLCKVSSE